MKLTDTHSHIHDPQYGYDSEAIIAEANSSGVERIFCIGTSADDSAQAVEFAEQHVGCYATIAQHPHEAKSFGEQEQKLLASLASSEKVIGVGECGLDYYYNHSDRPAQETTLRWHLQLAQDYGLPLAFHIRNAFAEFWPIFDEFAGLEGLVHSFSAGPEELEQALSRGLYIAFNGIMTFTKDKKQLEALKLAPLERIVVETDAPFLTPVPFRGKINKPKYVATVAKFISDFKEVPLSKLAKTTENNVNKLFGI